MQEERSYGVTGDSKFAALQREFLQYKHKVDSEISSTAREMVALQQKLVETSVALADAKATIDDLRNNQDCLDRHIGQSVRVRQTTDRQNPDHLHSSNPSHHEGKTNRKSPSVNSVYSSASSPIKKDHSFLGRVPKTISVPGGSVPESSESDFSQDSQEDYEEPSSGGGLLSGLFSGFSGKSKKRSDWIAECPECRHRLKLIDERKLGDKIEVGKIDGIMLLKRYRPNITNSPSKSQLFGFFSRSPLNTRIQTDILADPQQGGGTAPGLTVASGSLSSTSRATGSSGTESSESVLLDSVATLNKLLSDCRRSEKKLQDQIFMMEKSSEEKFKTWQTLVLGRIKKEGDLMKRNISKSSKPTIDSGPIGRRPHEEPVDAHILSDDDDDEDNDEGTVGQINEQGSCEEGGEEFSRPPDRQIVDHDLPDNLGSINTETDMGQLNSGERNLDKQPQSPKVYQMDGNIISPKNKRKEVYESVYDQDWIFDPQPAKPAKSTFVQTQQGSTDDVRI